MASTVLTFASLLKTRFSKDRVEDLTQRGRPWYSMIPKDTGMSGDGEKVPLIYGNAQGLAVTLADAQGAATNVAGKHFNLVPGDFVGSVSIGLKVLRSSRNNEGAWLENREAEINSLYEAFADALDLTLWSNAGLALGRRLSISTNTITLVNPTDVYNFFPGMKLMAADDEGLLIGDTPRAGSAIVVSVDRTNGTVTVDNAAGITTFSDNDYLFRYGTYGGSTGVNKVFAGMQAFITANDNPATLYSMVRTTDPTLLAGCRVPSTALAGLGVEQRLKVLGAKMSGVCGAKGFDLCFLHPENFQTLESALASRGIRPLEDETTQFGFAKIVMVVGTQKVSIYAEPRCPIDHAFVVRKDSWKLKSVGELISPATTEAGIVLVPGATSTDLEYRLVSFPAAVCRAPRDNGRVPLAA